MIIVQRQLLIQSPSDQPVKTLLFESEICRTSKLTPQVFATHMGSDVFLELACRLEGDNSLSIRLLQPLDRTSLLLYHIVFFLVTSTPSRIRRVEELLSFRSRCSGCRLQVYTGQLLYFGRFDLERTLRRRLCHLLLFLTKDLTATQFLAYIQIFGRNIRDHGARVHVGHL